ncbi:Toprim domain-containing protein OS=Castellaniella sp OX=1955812 GN=EPN31_14065 PE=4 SV=1 [Castellaniella denitrificans]
MIDYGKLNAALTDGGLIPGDIEAGRLIRCKVDGDRGGKRSGAYRLFDDDLPTCPWWNWKTGAQGVWVSLDRPLTDAERNRQRQRIEQARAERQAQQVAQWADNRVKLIRLWGSAQAITTATPAGLYLAGRGLMVPASDALRYVPRLDYWDDGGLVGTFPAMLAAVTSPAGDLVAIHRTYLTGDGHKAPVPTVKKLSATAGPLAGASVKIGAPAPRPDGRLGLGVAEGIETALAASMLAGIPVWPCVSAHGLEAFDPPPGLHHLYVMGDRDDSGTGQKAAAILAQRAAAAGLAARVLLPDAVGDWNDELICRRAAV